MFMTSAKHYFEYLREALYEDMPTMLVKILGIHAIKVSFIFCGDGRCLALAGFVLERLALNLFFSPLSR